MRTVANFVWNSGEFAVFWFLLLPVATGKHDCYDRHSKEYVGTSTDLPAACTDCECLPWPPEYGLAENYCRFVGGWDLPRCLVDNYLGLHLEDCNIPACDVHSTCYHGDGSDYRDGGQFTASGHGCLEWNSVQDKGVNSTLFPNADLRGNECRNPNGQSRPWCYFSVNGTVQQGFCPIVQCRSNVAEQFRQHLFQTNAYGVVATQKQHAVFFETGNFSVQRCLEECLNFKEFICRSVIVGTFRQVCNLNDLNQLYVEPVYYAYADLYVRSDTLCDVFEVSTYGTAECLLPLGMEVGFIQDAQLTASSYLDDDHAPWAGRLNGNSSWMPDPMEPGPSAMAEARPYLQIDFSERMKITGVIVQGGGEDDLEQGNWVEEFEVLVTHDPAEGKWDKLGVYHTTVTEYGSTLAKTFQANREPMCMQLVLFESTLYTGYLRINPTKWHGKIALRLEVIGCKDTGCQNTLGMINGQISDMKIMVSSSFDKPDDVAQVRLSPFHADREGGWTPTLYDGDPRISIDLVRPHTVTSIVAQGCDTGRVTSVEVGCLNQFTAHSFSPQRLAEIRSTEKLGGGSFATDLYRHTFHTPITCSIVYVRPIEWIDNPCMRVELVGCLHLSGCNLRLGMESGEITDDQVSSQRNQSTHTFMPVAATAAPRLHQWAGLSCGWTLGDTSRGDWLQIDLVTLHTITGIAVQAGRNQQYSVWVDAFRLLYAVEGRRDGNNLSTTQSWQVYQDTYGTDLFFKGFHSPYMVSYQTLTRSFISRRIRIEPVSWSSVFPGLRVEVIGCELAEYGEFCSEATISARGLCIGRIESASIGACSEILGHDAIPIVVYSESQGELVQSLLLNGPLDRYRIGLVMHVAENGDITYVWSDGSGLTYSRFGNDDVWDSDKPAPGNSYCTFVPSDKPEHWQIQPCEYKHEESGTICQYDLDECAGNHGCSHKCLNYPGGYQCLCPDGFVLDNRTRKVCVALCSHFISFTNSRWLQRDRWCYVEGESDATWQEANSACLSYEGGSRLPAENDEFWDGFNQSNWNLTWITTDSHSQPVFFHALGLPDALATDCTAVGFADDGVSAELGNITSVPCSISLPYVCILEFETVGELTGDRAITVNASFGLMRRWYYPPYIHNETLTTVFEFSTLENHTVRFDILHLNYGCTDRFSIYDKFSDGTSLFRGTFCDVEKVSLTSQSSDISAVLQISPPKPGDPRAQGMEVIFTEVDCGSDCVPQCRPLPPILTSPSGSINTLGVPIAVFTTCSWLISVQSGKFVNLTFTDYQVDMHSSIAVFFSNVQSQEDRATDAVSLSFTTMPLNIISNTSEVTLLYLTGLEAEAVGFRVEYTTVDIPGCYVGQDIDNVDCHYPSAYFAFPLYLSVNRRYTWNIITPPGTFVEMIFDSFDIPSSDTSCQGTAVLVFEGDKPLVDNLCNDHPPDNPIQSHLNSIRVQLYSESVEGRDFLARYRGVNFQPRREVVVTSDNCEPGWYYYSGHCYMFHETAQKVRWTDADLYCRSQSAHLVSIRDSHEADYVHYMLTTVWSTNRPYTYIGLADRNEQGVFRWSDGSPMGYTDWHVEFGDEDVNEYFEHTNPNGGRFEECTTIDMTDVRTPSNWIDVACAAMGADQCLCKKTAADYVGPKAIGNFVTSGTQRSCPPPLFTCGSGECIHSILLCNSGWDCSDGSDEDTTLCSGTDVEKFTFECDDSRIPASSYCDFVDDCDSGSDEHSCIHPNCTDSQFRCESGQCIDASKRCDLTTDCIDDSDSNRCEMYSGGYQCYSGRWIPGRITCDSYPDCQGLQYEDEVGCDYMLGNVCDDTQIQCRAGVCVDASNRCIYDLDEFGYMTGCRDVTHLRDCESFECPVMMFKCPDSYCIPLRFRCNDEWDCPNGEDEQECADYVCAGAYKCMSGGYCISLDKVCDGMEDCLDDHDDGGDDELFCNMSCPAGCMCVGLSYSCENTEWSRQSADMIPRDVRQLFLNSVTYGNAPSEPSTGSKRKKRDNIPAPLTLEDLLFVSISNYPWIRDLELINNNIVELTPGMFNQNPNMHFMDLSNNSIEVLRKDTFQGLSALRHLSLANNKLSIIEVGAFRGLDNLAVLDVRNIQPVTSREVFDDLKGLQKIIASQYLFCCVRDEIPECIAPKDQFSDCKDLISNTALRYFIWILGLSALAGNLFVFGLRIVKSRRQRDTTPVQTFLITNLAASDFLMGVYMITIAGADLHFRDNYALAAAGWRASITCKIAGLLSIASSEVSVFVVMILSLDRFLKIVFPFRFGLHLTLKRTQLLVVAAWVVGLLMSLLPAVITVYFTESYYGSSSVCLALPLVPDLPDGWEYMFSILGVNLVCFLIMLVCYMAIFVTVKQSSRKIKGGKVVGRTSQSAREIRIAMKMALIVGTDFVCWMPIIILAILAIAAKVSIPQEVYAWIAVFILPLNSSINPYLYTLSTYWGRKKKTKARSSLMTHNQFQTPSPGMSRTQMSNLGAYTNDSLSADIELQPMLRTVLAQLEKYRIIPVVHGEVFNLSSPQECSSDGKVPETTSPVATDPSYTLTEDDVASVVEDVTMALSWLHTNGISKVHLKEDSILFEKDSNGRQRAYLKLPQSTLGAEKPNGRQQDRVVDIGVELDNKALESLIGRLKKKVGDKTHNGTT